MSRVRRSRRVPNRFLVRPTDQFALMTATNAPARVPSETGTFGMAYGVLSPRLDSSDENSAARANRRKRVRVTRGGHGFFFFRLLRITRTVARVRVGVAREQYTSVYYRAERKRVDAFFLPRRARLRRTFVRVRAMVGRADGVVFRVAYRFFYCERRVRIVKCARPKGRAISSRPPVTRGVYQTGSPCFQSYWVRRRISSPIVFFVSTLRTARVLYNPNASTKLRRNGLFLFSYKINYGLVKRRPFSIVRTLHNDRPFMRSIRFIDSIFSIGGTGRLVSDVVVHSGAPSGPRGSVFCFRRRSI